MNKLFLFLILFLLHNSKGISLEQEYIRLANFNLKQFAKEIKTFDPNFIVKAIGGGLMFDVDLLDLQFKYKKTVSIDEARKLFVISLDKFLLKINSDSKIRIYLHEFPFTAKNMDWGLSFNYFPSDLILDNFVTYAFLDKGKICYKNVRTTLLVETYEQARNIVYRNPLIPK